MGETDAGCGKYCVGLGEGEGDMLSRKECGGKVWRRKECLGEIWSRNECGGGGGKGKIVEEKCGEGRSANAN